MSSFTLLLSVSVSAGAQDQKQSAGSEPLPSIETKTAGCTRHDGLLTFHVDRERAQVFLETPPAADRGDEVGRYIYVEGLATGLGSNPVGLDRGQLGASRLVVFRRVGRRLLIEQPNLQFRALSDNDAERRAVRQSFATSILWAGDVVAEEPDGRALVDFTSFVVRDAHDVVAALQRTKQGDYKLDAERSVLNPEACLAFPDNLEFEAILTFSGSKPGSEVRQTVPASKSITLVQHHSLLRLPDEGYRPRRFDPRAGSFAVTFLNYAAPLSAPMETRWIARHRLEKTDPDAARSPVKEAIVYYVDSGAPEPVRSALVEGASWWGKAFEAAGFVDAFRVEVLPEGVHPLDARYNVIQWVHRSTRGWSYGGSIMDPRTGEIIKGHVSLGSLRVRQDRLLFEGLAGTDRTGSGAADDPIELALARIRQLSAHEVGHTLGFTHNFAASTYGGRASVMDYPAPLIGLTGDGELDFSDAYGVGVGQWDQYAVRYAYTQFPAGIDEEAGLRQMVREGLRKGLLFLTDADARPAGAAHPLANLWDNGRDPVAELEHTLSVRRIALDRFGERNVLPGTPLSLLREVLVPVYLFHRYQVDAAVKVIGGMEYSYAVRGDGQRTPQPVDADRQRRAMAVLLDCLSPRTLDIPESVLSLLSPRPFGYDRNREMFHTTTGAAFDALGAAATAADIVVGGLLNSGRCARLVDFHRRDPDLPSLESLLDVMIGYVFATPTSAEWRSPRYAELLRTVQQVVVARLIGLGADDRAPPGVTSRIEHALRGLHDRLESATTTSSAAEAHSRHLAATIHRYLHRPLDGTLPPVGPAEPPPGSPIGGSTSLPDLGHCSWGHSCW